MFEDRHAASYKKIFSGASRQKYTTKKRFDEKLRVNPG
jgi:hypothetical protein